MTEVILTGSNRPDGIVRVSLNDGSLRWPIVIYGANKSTVSLTDQEGQVLLRVLQERYPLDGLASV